MIDEKYCLWQLDRNYPTEKNLLALQSRSSGPVLIVISNFDSQRNISQKKIKLNGSSKKDYGRVIQKVEETLKKSRK